MTVTREMFLIICAGIFLAGYYGRDLTLFNVPFTLIGGGAVVLWLLLLFLGNWGIRIGKMRPPGLDL